VEEAQRALLAAKVEASSGYKGLGIVKLMGRSSGFIAMQASMASGVRACSCEFQICGPVVGVHHLDVSCIKRCSGVCTSDLHLLPKAMHAVYPHSSMAACVFCCQYPMCSS
jgi:hypothetical protein